MPTFVRRNDKLSRSCLSLALALTLCPSLASAADDGTSFQSGVALYNRQNFRSAIQQFDKAAQTNTKPPTVRYYKALCHQKLGEFTEANALFQELCDKYPTSPEAKLAATVLAATELARTPAPPVTPKGAASTPSASAVDPKKLTPAQFASLMGNDASHLTDKEWQSLPDHTSIPFTRGHGSHLYVNVLVNGRPVNAIFDTGAELCLFSKADLDRAGVVVNPNGRKIGMSGVGGNTTGIAQMATVKLGDIERRLEIVYTEGLPTPSLLGETFFKPFDYEIDNRGGTIKLSKKTRDGQSSVAEPYDTIVIPYTPAGENMVVEAQINGRPIQMFFDTGAAGITMSAVHMAMLGLSIPEDAQVGYNTGVGGRTPSYHFRVREIRLGPISRTNIMISVLENGPSLPLLGQPFFGDRRFSIDNKKRVIKFWR